MGKSHTISFTFKMKMAFNLFIFIYTGLYFEFAVKLNIFSTDNSFNLH